MKKIFKPIFWVIFGIWNIALLFIITGKKTPIAVEQTHIAHVNVPKKDAQITKYENENSTYSFTGEELNSVQLKKYKEKVIWKTLLEKENVKMLFTGENVKAPDANTPWKIAMQDNVMTMTWKNEQNITFIQKWIFGNNYDINIELSLINNSDNSIRVVPVIDLEKKEFEKHQSFIFSGISIAMDKKIKNIPQSSVKKESFLTNKGWCAFNEKYWLTACASKTLAQISLDSKSDKPYNLQAANQVMIIAPKTEGKSTFSLYIGPKEIKALKKFGQDNACPNIENSIDYGWLFFLTKPVNYILQLLVENVSSVALALILLTLMLKIISWPFTRSSHLAIKRMNALNPAIAELRARLKDSPELLNREIFALYKRHKINPISGCLPTLMSTLLIFPVYKVLSVSIHLRCAPFPFWIKDLSAADPTSWLNLFGLLPFHAPDFLHIGAWPLIMGITMFIQQVLSTPANTGTNNEQAIMKYGMPIVFTWMMASLSAGVVIYWTITHVLTIVQILWINLNERKKAPKRI